MSLFNKSLTSQRYITSSFVLIAGIRAKHLLFYCKKNPSCHPLNKQQHIMKQAAGPKNFDDIKWQNTSHCLKFPRDWTLKRSQGS
jgi:hypothetical protein